MHNLQPGGTVGLCVRPVVFQLPVNDPAMNHDKSAHTAGINDAIVAILSDASPRRSQLLRQSTAKARPGCHLYPFTFHKLPEKLRSNALYSGGGSNVTTRQVKTGCLTQHLKRKADAVIVVNRQDQRPAFREDAVRIFVLSQRLEPDVILIAFIQHFDVVMKRICRRNANPVITQV